MLSIKRACVLDVFGSFSNADTNAKIDVILNLNAVGISDKYLGLPLLFCDWWTSSRRLWCRKHAPKTLFQFSFAQKDCNILKPFSAELRHCIRGRINGRLLHESLPHSLRSPIELKLLETCSVHQTEASNMFLSRSSKTLSSCRCSAAAVNGVLGGSGNGEGAALLASRRHAVFKPKLPNPMLCKPIMFCQSLQNC